MDMNLKDVCKIIYLIIFPLIFISFVIYVCFFFLMSLFFEGVFLAITICVFLFLSIPFFMLYMNKYIKYMDKKFDVF